MPKSRLASSSCSQQVDINEIKDTLVDINNSKVNNLQTMKEEVETIHKLIFFVSILQLLCS